MMVEDTLAEVPEVSAALVRCKGGIDAFVELAIVAEVRNAKSVDFERIFRGIVDATARDHKVSVAIVALIVFPDFPSYSHVQSVSQCVLQQIGL